ncbi:MAG: hypothetical protein HYX47_02585 [Burkholderiales bacterium]|nr:hypothetical protein [Burkholderiales bacterium]
MRSTLYPALLAAVLCSSCGGGGEAQTPAAATTPPVAVPVVAQGVRGTVTMGTVTAIGSPYGGSGTVPPGPESEGLSLVAGRAHPTEQGRGVVDGTLRFGAGDTPFTLFSPAALPDGSVIAGLSVTGDASRAPYSSLSRVELNGRITSLRGPWEEQVRCEALSACQFQYSWGVATGLDGRVYASSTLNGELYIIDADLRSFQRFPGFPTFAQDFTVDAQNNLYFVRKDQQIWKRAPDGTISMVPADLSGAGTPSPVQALPDGRLVYGTYSAIHLYTPGYETRKITGFAGVSGLAVDRAGNIYIRDSQIIQRLSPGGDLTAVVGRSDPTFVGIELGPLPSRMGTGSGGRIAVVPGGLVFAAAATPTGAGYMLLFARLPVEPAVP